MTRCTPDPTPRAIARQQPVLATRALKEENTVARARTEVVKMTEQKSCADRIETAWFLPRAGSMTHPVSIARAGSMASPVSVARAGSREPPVSVARAECASSPVSVVRAGREEAHRTVMARPMACNARTTGARPTIQETRDRRAHRQKAGTRNGNVRPGSDALRRLDARRLRLDHRNRRSAPTGPWIPDMPARAERATHARQVFAHPVSQGDP